MQAPLALLYDSRFSFSALSLPCLPPLQVRGKHARVSPGAATCWLCVSGRSASVSAFFSVLAETGVSVPLWVVFFLFLLFLLAAVLPSVHLVSEIKLRLNPGGNKYMMYCFSLLSPRPEEQV